VQEVTVVLTGAAYPQPTVDDAVQVDTFDFAPRIGASAVHVTAVPTVYGDPGEAVTGVQEVVVVLTGAAYWQPSVEDVVHDVVFVHAP
jgi:hypothetical protein